MEKTRSGEPLRALKQPNTPVKTNENFQKYRFASEVVLLTNCFVLSISDFFIRISENDFLHGEQRCENQRRQSENTGHAVGWRRVGAVG